MRRTTTSLLLTAALFTLSASPALADDAEVAAKIGVFEYNATAFDKRVAADEWDQVGYTVKNMGDALAEIQKKDPKRDVSKLAQRLADARAKLEAHTRAEAAAKDLRRRIEEIERAHRQALSRAASYDKNQGSDIQEAVAALTELAEVHAACTQQALTGTTCTLAARRAELAKGVLGRSLAAAVPEAVTALGRAADELVSTGEFGKLAATANDLEALRASWTARYAPLAAIADASVEPATFDPIIDAARSLAAKIPAAAKKSRLPTGMGAAPATVVADTKVTFPKLKVLKVVMGKAWDVELNDFRVPVNRTAHGAALLQQPGEAYCRVVPFLVTQPYQAGKYGIAHVDRFDPGYMISACK